jgi:TolB-like protein/Flp pilus assembly protein TadD
VLPFVNMSGDPSQDYLGRGIAEDIITVLSSFPGIRVASRTSSFVYDKPAKVQEIARTLGVRYVLEGSVRKEADQVRVTAQLIDAASGDHVWADRYDEDGANVFVLQDEVANKIYDSVAGLKGNVRREEERQAWRKSAPSLREYDYYLRGSQIFMAATPESNARSREVWQEGLARFPTSALLRNKLAWTYVRDISMGLSDDILRDAERAWKLGSEAQAAENKPQLVAWLVHWQMAVLYQWHDQDFERSVVEAEAAIRMVPQDAFSRADLGKYLARAGRTDQAIEWGLEAIRREVSPPDFYRWNLAWAYYLAGRPADALAELGRMGRKGGAVLESVAKVRLGRLDEARVVMAGHMKSHPGWSLRTEAFTPLKEPLKQAYLDDLRKAGMPEG